MERAEDRCKKTGRKSPDNVIDVDSPACSADVNVMPRCPPPKIPERPFCRSKRARLALQRIQVKKEEYEQASRPPFSATAAPQSKRDVQEIGNSLALDVLGNKNDVSNAMKRSKPTSFVFDDTDLLPSGRKDAPWLSQLLHSKAVTASKADEHLYQKKIIFSPIRPLDAHSDVSKDKTLKSTIERNSSNALPQSDVRSKDSESSWSPPSENSDSEFFADKNLGSTMASVRTRRSNPEKAMSDLHAGSSNAEDLEKSNLASRQWTREEERTLLRSIDIRGRQWDKIAQDVKTRTPHQCLMRWHRLRSWVSEEENSAFGKPVKKKKETLQQAQRKVRTTNKRKNVSNGSKSATHNKRWSPREEYLFVESLKRYGTTSNWDAIARAIGTRTVDQCRKKYSNTRYSLKKKLEGPKW